MEPRADREILRDLAWFRYTLRRFLHFSEKAARGCGVTPQQHQLMLGIAGFSANGTATISELAEFLQERNHSVVGLVDRAAHSGLVQRTAGETDRRQVFVSLTPHGEEILAHLTDLHRNEAERVRAGFLTRRANWRPPAQHGSGQGAPVRQEQPAPPPRNTEEGGAL
jgi:DNA-binding MarR family transcriptional regulator